MSFTDTSFIIAFLPLALAVYWSCHKFVTMQNALLWVVSMAFYTLLCKQYVIVLVVCVLTTYICGLIHKKAAIVTGVIIHIAALCFFKYAGLFLDDILLPVGMSFYIFQAIGYMLDVLGEKTEPERNILNISLFLSFFPVITAGPILRYNQFKEQMIQKKKMSFVDFQRAVIIFSWGIFMKLVIANRIAIIVDGIFGSYETFYGQLLWVGAIGYSLQIYTDFAGYSFMAMAISLLFGYRVLENFKQPYFSTGIIDFWRRWHISLSSWLRDYIYIPMGGNRKGKLHKYINILVVFLISGAWHGSEFRYIFWGGCHGILQIVEDITSPFWDKESSRIRHGLMVICTFILVSILWVFFRLDSFVGALSYIKRMFTAYGPWEITDGTLLSLGVDWIHLLVLLISLVLLFIVSYAREHEYSTSVILNQSTTVKIIGFTLFMLFILCFGKYGSSYSAKDFIYAGF